MSYQPNIPQATDRPSVSQGDILTNFQELNTQIGTEHVALDAGADNGKHKYVTLQQNPSAPAPVGTEVYLSQEISGGTAYMRFLNSSAQNLFIPVRHEFFSLAITKNEFVDLVDMATVLSGSHSAGHIFLFDNNERYRTIFSPFVYIGGTLDVPGALSGGIGQLPSGTALKYFTTAGSVLRVKTDKSLVTTVTLIITESFA